MNNDLIERVLVQLEPELAQELGCELAKISKEFKKYKDIEDNLGIDLITLFKAMLQGIYYKGAYGTNDYGKIVYKEHPTIIFETTSKLYCFKPTFFDFINLKDYGKTWALTKEELL